MNRFGSYLMASLTALALQTGSLAAQDPQLDLSKELTVEGSISVGAHTLPMEAGRVYRLRVKAFGFQPNLHIRPGSFAYTSNEDQGDTVQCYFLPQDTRKYRLNIVPNINDELSADPLKYELTVTPVAMDEKPLLEETATLTTKDPKYKSPSGYGREASHHHSYVVPMKSRRLYIIDMVRTGDSNSQFDPYLILENPSGETAATDDDSGENNNSRIFFMCRRDGDYQIIATTFSEEAGPYTLTVRSQAGQ